MARRQVMEGDVDMCTQRLNHYAQVTTVFHRLTDLVDDHTEYGCQRLRENLGNRR